ncbi:hypothetical protein KIPB_016803, partial [Kipferlia bialata]
VISLTNTLGKKRDKDPLTWTNNGCRSTGIYDGGNCGVTLSWFNVNGGKSASGIYIYMCVCVCVCVY